MFLGLIDMCVKRACVIYNATLHAFLLAMKGGWAAWKNVTSTKE